MTRAAARDSWCSVRSQSRTSFLVRCTEGFNDLVNHAARSCTVWSTQPLCARERANLWHWLLGIEALFRYSEVFRTSRCDFVPSWGLLHRVGMLQISLDSYRTLGCRIGERSPARNCAENATFQRVGRRAGDGSPSACSTP